MSLSLEDLEKYAMDAEVSVDDSMIKGVSELALLQLNLEDAIEAAEEQMKRLKARLRNVQETLLPAAMSEAGVKSVSLANGAVVKIKPFYSAHISEERAERAFAWLREHGFSDIIKNQLTVDIRAGQDNVAAAIEQELQEVGAGYTKKESVHSATLRAWVKEQYEAGKPPPADVFGTFCGEKSEIKRPKGQLDT